MRHALATLARNLAAGLRLALFRPLSSTAFRVTLGALLGLVAFDLVLDIALDGWRVGQGATFNLGAAQHHALAVSILLLASAVLALAFRQPHLTLALAVAILASEPLLKVVGTLYRAWTEGAGRSWTPTLMWTGWAIWLLLMAWSFILVARALMLSLAPRGGRHWLRVIAGAVVLFGTAFVVHAYFHRQEWWYPERVAAQDPRRPSPAAEQVLVRQPQLLAASLAALAAHRPGVADLYFVGFGGDGGQDVFRKDVDAARAAVHERFDIDGRSVVLINNPDTLLAAPLATASNLRAALKAVGSKIDAEEDVVLVFLTSHGSRDHKLAVEFRPLRLDPLDGAALRQMLDDAGIRWRIVVISACYAGGFIPALSDPRTLVMTAAAADRTSFGCSTDSEMTYFTEALFRQALAAEPSLTGAFAKAQALVSAREQAEGLAPPSDPQIFVGEAMPAKLQVLTRQAR